jgi:hypothetical protein
MRRLTNFDCRAKPDSHPTSFGACEDKTRSSPGGGEGSSSCGQTKRASIPFGWMASSIVGPVMLS